MSSLQVNLTPLDSSSRPSLPHMATSPELVGFRTSMSPPHIDFIVNAAQHSGNSPSLLDALNERSNSDYRTITFKTTTRPNPDYQNRVSFDTIDIQVADEDPTLDFSDDDYFSPVRSRHSGNELDVRGRNREDDFARSPGASPHASPTRMLSPIRGVDMSRLFNQNRYPTTPIVTRRGCTFTKMHKKFENLYLGKIKHLYPVLPGRVIVVYISGRQHTWVALDWILRSFIEHGDTVVVATAINHTLGQPSAKISNYPSPSRYQAKTSRVRQRQRNRPEYIKEIAGNIMNYAMTVVNPNIIAKITVEICEGHTKEVLKDIYKLYEPNIVSTASKVNARNSAPLKSWLSSRLSDRLVKNFPLPVIVVPALNMAQFERELKDEIEGISPATSVNESSSGYASSMSRTGSKQTENLVSSSTMKIIGKEHEKDDEDASSLSDGSLHSLVSSSASVASGDSYNSYDEISDLYADYRRGLHKELHKLTLSKRDDQYFVNFVKAISDKSLQFCEDLRSVNPDFRGEGSKLARAITGSNSFGAVPFKTKSLLAPVEEKPRPSSGGISYEELKRNLKRNALRSNEEVNGPTILIDPPSASPSPSTTPRPTMLKFSDAPKPQRKSRGGPMLKKFLSNDESTADKVNLEPSKSHPDIRTVMLTDSGAKKKKKKKFWKLF